MNSRPRFRSKPPSYRRRRGSADAIVTLMDCVTRKRRDYHLAAYGSPESREAYHRVIAAWEANGRRLPENEAASPSVLDRSGVTVTELIRDYWRWAEAYYRPKHVQSLIGALRLLKQYFGHSAAATFGPNMLRMVRDEMIRGDATATPPRSAWSRKYINSQIQRIRHVFKWAAAREIVPVSNHIVWDAVEIVEFTRKHTANVHECFGQIREIIGRLVEKRDQRRDGFVATIRKAMETTLGRSADDVLKVLAKQGIPRAAAKEAVEIAAQRGRFTIFCVVDALTRLAGRIKHAGDRTEADERASALLALAA